MAKKFFYVCAGLLMLALSYHLGAQSVLAQVGVSAFGFGVNSSSNAVVVMTPNGDVYARPCGGNLSIATAGMMDGTAPATRIGNFWGATPVSVQSATWGQVKSTYRK